MRKALLLLGIALSLVVACGDAGPGIDDPQRPDAGGNPASDGGSGGGDAGQAPPDGGSDAGLQPTACTVATAPATIGASAS
ncbi:MAG: hypothetical protein ACK4N5_10395, partial [Myxococcales bacterium]